MPDLMEELIKKISLGHFPMPITLKYLPARSEFDPACVRLTMKTLDRATGKESVVSMRVSVPPYLDYLDYKGALEWVFSVMCDLVKHELAEHFVVDGHRVFDPHMLAEQRNVYGGAEMLRLFGRPDV